MTCLGESVPLFPDQFTSDIRRSRISGMLVTHVLVHGISISLSCVKKELAGFKTFLIVSSLSKTIPRGPAYIPPAFLKL